MVVNKKTIIDENNNTVAVVIPIDEWEEIEQLIQEKKSNEKREFKKVDMDPFFGIIELHEDPLEFQKRIRAEWDREIKIQ